MVHTVLKEFAGPRSSSLLIQATPGRSCAVELHIWTLWILNIQNRENIIQEGCAVCFHGRNTSSLLWLFAMGAAESSVQRDATSQEDASVSASGAELSAIQEGGGVLESKVQRDHCPPFIRVNLVPMRLFVPSACVFTAAILLLIPR